MVCFTEGDSISANRVFVKGCRSGTGLRAAPLIDVALAKSRKPSFLNIRERKSAALPAGQIARTGVAFWTASAGTRRKRGTMFRDVVAFSRLVRRVHGNAGWACRF
jgi:hypothetical protein